MGMSAVMLAIAKKAFVYVMPTFGETTVKYQVS